MRYAPGLETGSSRGLVGDMALYVGLQIEGTNI